MMRSRTKPSARVGRAPLIVSEARTKGDPPMRDAFREVLALQSEWTNANSPAMERRGQLVRTVIPAELRNHLEALGAAESFYTA